MMFKKLNKVSLFPSCIGRFPECSQYNADMTIEQRGECKNCPFKG